MTKYNLTPEESEAVDDFGASLFRSLGLIMASVMFGLITGNIILMVGGSLIGLIMLLHTCREETKTYNKLYPKTEDLKNESSTIYEH